MKLKTLLAVLALAGLAVSVAIAAPPPGKGKPGSSVAASTGTTSSTTGTTTTEPGKGKGKGKGKGPACKPGRSLVLKGDFVSVGGTGFAMTVKSGNAAAKQFVGKQLTVVVEAATRFTKAKLADLKAGDKVMVQGYVCKADATALSAVARRVTAKGPKAADDDDKVPTTTTGTTTTTGGTTTGTTTTG